MLAGLPAWGPKLWARGGGDYLLPHVQLSGGIRALALVSALSTAATFAMTATTAGHIAWPNAAFQLMGVAIIAALILSHARHTSTAQLAFAAGVIAAAAPSLAAAAQHWLDHWDDFMTWLPNATYIWRFGAFPTIAAPPVSDLPGYPPGSSLILAALWSLAGRVVDDAGPVINVLGLMTLPGLVLRVLDVGRLPSRLHVFALGAMLGLLATVLNVAMDWHWTLSSLPEIATLVAFAAAFALADECLFRGSADARARLAALAAIFAFITNLKQTGIALVGILVAAALATAWIGDKGERRDVRSAAISIVLVLLPSIAVWLCWHAYLAEIFPAHAVSFRPLGQWYYALLPDLLGAMGRTMAEHWLFFALIAIVVARGVYIITGRLAGGRRAPMATGDRLAVTFTLVELAWVGVVIVCEIGAFSEGEVRDAAEFFRYQGEVGGAGVLVAMVMAVEWLRRPRFVALLPAVLALQVIAVWMVRPADGIYQYGGVIPAAEIETLRQLGREAGRLVARRDGQIDVTIYTDAQVLALIVMRYQMWATAPTRMTHIEVVWPDAEGGPITHFTKAAQHPTPSVVLIERGSRCGLYAGGGDAELLPASEATPFCRSLLLELDRKAIDRKASGTRRRMLAQ